LFCFGGGGVPSLFKRESDSLDFPKTDEKNREHDAARNGPRKLRA
jgi:hypothetical protein